MELKNTQTVLLAVVALLSVAVIYLIYDKFMNKQQIITRFNKVPTSYTDILSANTGVSPATGDLSLVYSADVNGNLITLPNIPLIPQGTIVAYNSSTAPDGWVLCDGKLYDKTAGSIVTTAGTNTIQAPDLRGRFILGSGQGTGLTNRTLGQTGGAETHVLTQAELPAHTHTFYNGSYFGGGNIDWPNGGNWGKNAAVENTSSVGSNQAHNNMPPFYVLTYIMKL